MARLHVNTVFCLQKKKQSFSIAVETLWARLDPGTVHWWPKNSGMHYNVRKKVYQIMLQDWKDYSKLLMVVDCLTRETRDAFLYSQLQAGLKLALMECPRVSGSLSYKQLCVAAKQEEKQADRVKKAETSSRETSQESRSEVHVSQATGCSIW